MASPTTAPLLEINTLITRPFLIIDKKRYELRTRDEFTYLTDRDHLRRFERLGRLLQLTKTSKAQRTERDGLVDDFCQLILIAPPKVHAKLDYPNRLKIIEGFSSLLLPTLTAGATPATTPRRATRTRPGAK